MPERRAEVVDWLLLGGWTAVVYATLSQARRVFDAVEHAGWQQVVQIAVIASLAAICLALAIRLWFAARRPLLLLWAAGLAAAYGVAVFALTEMPAERVHLLEYGVVGWLAYRALGHRFAGREQAILAALLALNIGLADELIQGLTPRRYYDQKDVTVNAIAGLLAIAAVHALRAAGTRREAAP